MLEHFQVVFRILMADDILLILFFLRSRDIKVFDANMFDGVGAVLGRIATARPSTAVGFDAQMDSFVGLQVARFGKGLAAIGEGTDPHFVVSVMALGPPPCLTTMLFIMFINPTSGCAGKATGWVGTMESSLPVGPSKVLEKVVVILER